MIKPVSEVKKNTDIEKSRIRISKRLDIQPQCQAMKSGT